MIGQWNTSSFRVLLCDSETLRFFCKIGNLGGGFNLFFIFTPKIGEMIQFDEHIFQMGGSTTNLKFSIKMVVFRTPQELKPWYLWAENLAGKPCKMRWIWAPHPPKKMMKHGESFNVFRTSQKTDLEKK